MEDAEKCRGWVLTLNVKIARQRKENQDIVTLFTSLMINLSVTVIYQNQGWSRLCFLEIKPTEVVTLVRV